MAVLPFLEAARECVKKELAGISLHHNLGRVSKEKCFHVFCLGVCYLQCWSASISILYSIFLVCGWPFLGLEGNFKNKNDPWTPS